MPEPKKGPRLGSGPDHQKALLANLSRSLIEHERIRTTQAKARAVQPLAEKLITLARDGSLHARRQALEVICDRAVVHKLFSELGPRYRDRPGGYTRMVKLGPRQGDAAPMVILELV